MFTIIMNSRGRPAQLKRCLDAIEKNTTNLEELEVLVRADVDDLPTLEFLDLNANYKFCLRVKVGERPKSLCSSFNELARLARGKYIFVLTDDAELSTYGWDKIALEKIAKFKQENNLIDDIIYGYTSDTSVDKPSGMIYASFPIISKQAVDQIDMFMYDSFVGLGGDSSIYKLYNYIGRVVNMSEIVLDHINNNAIYKVMSTDATGREMRERSAASPIDPFSFDISKEAQKLEVFIKKYNDANR